MTEHHPAPFFIGDHLAMDFLNSAARPADAHVDWLGDGARFLDWLVLAGAVDPEVTRPFRGKGGAEEARDLRDWWRDFVDRHAGTALGPDVADELIPLNRLLARDDTYRVIEVARSIPEGHGHPPALHWHQVRRWTTPERLLQPIAEAIGDLICHADFRLVRGCEGVDCVLMFYDRTKAHSRRWCSMALCGNRAKAAAHRARSRQAALD